MSISVLLEMATSADPNRSTILDIATRMSVGELDDSARGAGVIATTDARHLVYIGAGQLLLSALLCSTVRAVVPPTPLNYRLSSDAIHELIARLPGPLIVVDGKYEIFCRRTDKGR